MPLRALGPHSGKRLGGGGGCGGRSLLRWMARVLGAQETCIEKDGHCLGVAVASLPLGSGPPGWLLEDRMGTRNPRPSHPLTQWVVTQTEQMLCHPHPVGPRMGSVLVATVMHLAHFPPHVHTTAPCPSASDPQKPDWPGVGAAQSLEVMPPEARISHGTASGRPSLEGVIWGMHPRHPQWGPAQEWPLTSLCPLFLAHQTSLLPVPGLTSQINGLHLTVLASACRR